ncbi:Proteophosphoglycan 5 [Rhodotorula toruloides ATCC 204091]|uniref:Proteophosphoglycan 5 n=1 Tax=Rhodotorula toruloides TaxID=5286 RepID=A0A2T0ADN0_RHOTO|nr:Proteophosphoglycan 5 [Rhodotorula toruloides ATCC 204091]PRQ76111.1 Proteophosphoglycan 5 [Rhodotorula toruloides]
MRKYWSAFDTTVSYAQKLGDATSQMLNNGVELAQGLLGRPPTPPPAVQPSRWNDLLVDVLKRIFEQLYLAHGNEQAPHSYLFLNKRAFTVAFPIWNAALTVPAHSPDFQDAFFKRISLQDPSDDVLRIYLRSLTLAAPEIYPGLFCRLLGTLAQLTSLTIAGHAKFTTLPPEFLDALKSMKRLSFLGLHDVDFPATSDVDLSCDVPSLRQLDLGGSVTLAPLAGGLGCIKSLTMRSGDLGGQHIPWSTLSRLLLRPKDGFAFDCQPFIDSLREYFVDEVNPPLPLERLELRFPALLDLADVELEGQFCIHDLCRIFEDLGMSKLKSLVLADIKSFGWPEASFALSHVVALELSGTCELYEGLCLNNFLKFLQSFPSLQFLRLCGFRFSSYEPLEDTAATIARLESHELAIYYPHLTAMLFALQSTQVTEVRYRAEQENLEMRWRRAEGEMFKGEHLMDMPSNEYHESKAIRPFALELCLLNKRIFDVAYPIHASRLHVPAGPYMHDAVLHGLLTTPGAAAYVRVLEHSLKSEIARLASHILGDCRNVTSFSILSGDSEKCGDSDEPTGLPAEPIRMFVRRLFIVPANIPDVVLEYQGESNFVRDLGALILDSVRPFRLFAIVIADRLSKQDAPLALEHVSLRLSGGEYAASSTAAYIGYRDLRSLLEIFSNTSIKSLELSDMHARSCTGLRPAAQLPNISSLTIQGRYSLVETFPALTTLHLRLLLSPFQSRGPVALVRAAANSAELVQLHRKGIGMSNVTAWTVECDGRKVRMWRETGGTLEWTWSHAEYRLAE